MIKRFLESLSQLVKDPQSHSYLLAVSGGADSCVMAHLFREAGLDFAMAHCNFHLRGEDSNHDMQLVKELAIHWGVKLLVKEFDTLALQKDSGKSIEMVARELRYNWFEIIGSEFDFLVTAHQADDAAETLLLNICRGCGMKGFLSIPAQNGKIIRPLLPFSAQEIRDYARQNNIPFAIDCTNTDESIQRNRLRSSVIPVLKELNPSLTDTLDRNRHILRQQYDFYRYSIEKLKKELLTKHPTHIALSRAKLQDHPHQRLILYEILSEFGFPAGISDELCDNNPKTGTQYHAQAHTLLVDRDQYLIQPDECDEPMNILLSSLEELKPYFSIELLENKGNITFEKDNNTLYLELNAMQFPVRIRTWKSGDFFYPLGSKGKQKISDFFTDHKFDRFSKNHTLLLEINHDIVWIIGHRSDERYKIDPNKTTHYYKLRYNGTL